MIVRISGVFSWNKEGIDHIRDRFEGLPGRAETNWKIEQWQEYMNVNDAKWKDLPPQEWTL